MVTIRRKFVTAVPGNHKHVNNEYIIGRLTAVLQIICDPDGVITKRNLDDGGYTLTVKTREPLYNAAKDLIEEWYPGMCEFDVTRGFSEED